MDARRLVPVYLGGLVGILVLLLALLIRGTGIQNGKKESKDQFPSFGYRAVLVFLVIGTILSPVTTIISPEYYNACSGDVIRASASAGEYLASLIPPGSKVYWAGGDSTAPLLHVPGITIFPAQINGAYTYKLGGEAETLKRLGLWNLKLAYTWQREADFILVETRNYSYALRLYLESGALEELTRSPLTNPCDPESGIRVFRKIK
jgi:hypothetical protein